MQIETYSANGAEQILVEKGIRDQIHEMLEVWHRYSGQHQYTEKSEALADLGGWETEVQIDLGPEDSPHSERLTPFLDAYHPEHKVAVEHEKKEQMRARWHLMKTQAANERSQARDIDVTVLLFPTDQDPSLRRTRRELEGPFFQEHFPIHVPVYAVEYTPDT